MIGFTTMVHAIWRLQSVWASVAPSTTVSGSASLVVLRGSLFEASWVSFLRRSSEVLLPVLWWSTTIRVDVVYGLRVIALVVIVTRSCSFVRFCNLPLLLELLKMLNLRLVEFYKLFIELQHYFGPLSD
jgi:hypothetical protein